MSFRKRNIALSNTGSKNPTTQNEKISTPGVRISPVTSHPTISTGTASLDKLLGLGAGQPLGTSLLIEEEGTTDFASALLRCYAAQAIIQGHKVFVVGPDGWASQLPGVVENRGSEKEPGSIQDSEKMKIAWRYERLGAHGEERRMPGLPDRNPNFTSQSLPAEQQLFCHTFDLTKRLQPPTESPPPTYIQPSHSSNSAQSPFTSILTMVRTHLTTSPSTSTRLIIPTLLNPLFYPPSASSPQYFISFLHSLRSLLRQHSRTLTIATSYPLMLYPRSTSSLTRWAEHLSDGVITLVPFSARESDGDGDDDYGMAPASADSEKVQGLITVLKRPVLSERGIGLGGSDGAGDVAFAVGRRGLRIVPFHLPPVGGGNGEEKKVEGERKELEF